MLYVPIQRSETLSVGSWQLPWAWGGGKALCSVPVEVLDRARPTLWWGNACAEALSERGITW